MASRVDRLFSDVCLRPAEHHHFCLRGRWFIFDVGALTVLDSSPLDEAILRVASDHADGHAILRRATLTGASSRKVAKRIKTLIKHRFLLGTDEAVRVAKLGRPRSYATFMINVSQRCNLTCPYCYVNQGLFDYDKKPIAQMVGTTADEIVERIHESFPSFETYAYHFYGGEPLLNFDAILRIVAAAECRARIARHKTDYYITTNGTLLSRKIADFLDRHRFTVYFSVDGDEANHDQLRKYINGKGSFQDVKRNLAYLSTKAGVHLIGSSVIRKGFSLRKAIGVLEGHGARQCKAERVRLRQGDVLSLQGVEHDAYIQDIEGLVDHYVRYLSSGRKPLDFRLSSKILQLFGKVRRDFFCPAGDRMFGVAANGELYPCALHVGRPQSKLGDVRSGIDKEKQKTFRTKFSAANQHDCQTCWTRHLCGGGCSAMVDRFGHEDCRSLRAESEAAIAIYQHFANSDIAPLFALISPKLAKWASGELEDAAELMLIEPAADQSGCSSHAEVGRDRKVCQISI